jgi:hypothetical protein
MRILVLYAHRVETSFSAALRGVCPPARCDDLALYDMNHPRPERQKRFLAKVEAHFSARRKANRGL